MSDDSRISDSLALTVPCPLCGATEDSPCVYVWPKGVKDCEFTYILDPTHCTVHSDTQHERLAKVGTPTKIAHNDRKNIVFNRRVRARQLAELKQLRTWLLQHGNIFKEDGIG